ncbi:phage tail protein [uncultured Roseovarius sp.]|uniref:phage tail protein n=1 Tax=uncultured Roseovarius sp. TaxID=293344 RepID=UPI002631FA89|nr:tail fiber protein [uncultured Roseovarius sp.]
MTIFTGDIYLFGGNFAPDNFAMCDGQLLAISQNEALFSLLGTMYGGDGRTTFGLPDLRDRVPIHAGTGPNLTARSEGDKGGSSSVVLTAAEIAPHAHALTARNEAPKTPSAGVLGAAGVYHADDNGPAFALDPAMVDATPPGPAKPHENRQPYMTLNFWICLAGIYPSRH